ncbi:MAG TPA: hypothetical protein VFQ61_29795 [Polyangiaceae bacterium]|nr:hypothetical protein [Polyangiaceae bacterium]
MKGSTSMGAAVAAAHKAMVFAGALSAATAYTLGIVQTPLAAAQEAAPSASASPSSTEPGNAEGGNAVDVAQLNEEGSQLYRARDYRHAVEKFILAYAADPDPNLLFNIARCYEAMGDTDVAIEKYETFLTTPGADPQGKQRARDALKRLHETQSNKEASVTPSSRSASSHATSAPPSSAAPSPKLTEGGTSILPWIALGAGAASASVGGVLYLLGVKDHAKVTDTPGYNDASRAASITESSARDLVDSGTRKKTIGGIGLGVGGALLTTSIVLFVTGNSGKNSEQGVALRVAPGTSGGSVSLRGSF